MVTDLHTQLDLVRDYVNTLDFETGIDRISSPDELAMWFSEQGLVDDLVEPTDQEHADAVAVREAIRDLLLANNGVAVDADAASKTLEAAGRKAHLGVRFENGRPLLAPEGDGAQAALGRVVATVAELAPTDEWKRLKTWPRAANPRAIGRITTAIPAPNRKVIRTSVRTLVNAAAK